MQIRGNDTTLKGFPNQLKSRDHLIIHAKNVCYAMGVMA